MLILRRCVLYKQKTAYEMRISDWSSDVCSSDLTGMARGQKINGCGHLAIILEPRLSDVEAMQLNRSPRPMLLGQGMQRMHHAAIPAPDIQNTQRTSLSEAVTLVQISADHVEDMLRCDRKRERMSVA